MPKNVFIISMSHSGSTLLDLILGCHTNAVSMGKLYASVKTFDLQRYCNCGEKIQDCIIWGKLKEELQNRDGQCYLSSYKRIMETIRDEYGPEKIVIDSSKNLKALKYLIDHNVKDLSIIFLLKDVRSFVISENKRNYSQETLERIGWRKIFTPAILYNILRWYYFNKKIKDYLLKNHLEYFQLGYEELCFQPEKMLRKICAFIGINYEEKMLCPENSESHMIRGNRMRRDHKKLREIVYDSRWLYSKKLLFFGLFLLPLIGWNNQNVYSHSQT